VMRDFLRWGLLAGALFAESDMVFTW
jgi:hypothetical protein